MKQSLINFLLWFKPSHYSIDIESGKHAVMLRCKYLFGVMYVLSERIYHDESGTFKEKPIAKA